MARTLTIVGPLRPYLVARYRKGTNPPPPDLGPTLLPRLDAAEASRAMIRNGVAVCGQFPPEAIDRVVDYFETTGRDAVENPHYESDAVLRLALDRGLVDVVRGYFQGEPILQLSRMWLSRPGVGFTHANRFHFDVADAKSACAFIYLTDVEDAAHGAHVVIEGTHDTKTLRDHWVGHLSEEAAHRRFPGRIRPILGPRGTVFLEELTLFHRGTQTDFPRLMLAIVYSLHRPAAPRDDAVPSRRGHPDAPEADAQPEPARKSVRRSRSRKKP